VLVRGPQEVLDRIRSIPTQASEAPARLANGPPLPGAMFRVGLVEEVEGRPVHTIPNRITVRIPTQKRKVYELLDVPVNFLCPANFLLRPKFIDERAGRVTVRLQGPIQAEPPRVQAYIDLSKGRFTSGLNHEPLQIQLPRDFQFAEDPPRVVTFELLPADFIPSIMDRGPSPP
jgi:hypothetical protein